MPYAAQTCRQVSLSIAFSHARSAVNVHWALHASTAPSLLLPQAEVARAIAKTLKRIKILDMIHTNLFWGLLRIRSAEP